MPKCHLSLVWGLINRPVQLESFLFPLCQDGPEADSFNKKVLALQWQFVKARVHELVGKKIFSLKHRSFYELPLLCHNFFV